VITYEPDRGTGFSSFAPRVMMNEADLPASHLILPASRVTYRFASRATTSRRGLREMGRREAKKAEVRGLRIESFETGRPEMRQTLDRAGEIPEPGRIALRAAQCRGRRAGGARFASNHLDDCAMLRVLGQSQKTIAWAYAFEFGMVGVIASLFGVLLASACTSFHPAARGPVAGHVAWREPVPAAFGVGMGLTLLVAFACRRCCSSRRCRRCA